MLRTELQAALNDVEVACQEVADGHEAALDLAEHPEVAEALRELAAVRRAAAEDLGEHIRALGDLPKAPDSDLETLREAFSFVRAALSFDEERTMLQEREQAEAAVAAAVDAALRQPDLPEAARRRLGQLAQEVEDARARLAALRATHD